MTSAHRVGIVAALAALALDQASKLWVLFGLDIAARGALRVGPFIDFVLAWNTGISYGWFQSDGPLGQAILLGFKAVAVAALAIWLWRTKTLPAALGLGLIIGGAIGNAIDRLAYGAVVDFVLLHATVAGKTYNWYIFNIADAAIVVGVALLLYDSVFGPDAAKAP